MEYRRHERASTPFRRSGSPESTPTRPRTRVNYADGIARERIPVGAVRVPAVQPKSASTEWLALAQQYSDRVPDDFRSRRVAAAGAQHWATPDVVLIDHSGNGSRTTRACERDPAP